MTHLERLEKTEQHIFSANTTALQFESKNSSSLRSSEFSKDHANIDKLHVVVDARAVCQDLDR